MSTRSDSAIARAFQDLRSRGELALMPFIPAGYPDLRTTQALLPALERGGASLIEIGIPFSDPIADGPVIQAAFAEALGSGVTLRRIFESVREARPRVSVPLVAMVSYSIVFRQGVVSFAREARSAGFDGLILPDLPPPEADQVCKSIQEEGLDTTLLVAPTTSPQRRRRIAQLSSGFIYYLSVTGITGERRRLPPELSAGVSQMKSITDRPVCVGFGISRSEHLSMLRGVADGAIVGSALVRRLQAHREAGPQAMVEAAEQFCRELCKTNQPGTG